MFVRCASLFVFQTSKPWVLSHSHLSFAPQLFVCVRNASGQCLNKIVHKKFVFSSVCAVIFFAWLNSNWKWEKAAENIDPYIRSVASMDFHCHPENFWTENMHVGTIMNEWPEYDFLSPIFCCYFLLQNAEVWHNSVRAAGTRIVVI